MSTLVSVSELESVWVKLIKKLQDEGVASVEITTDFYWVISTDRWNHFDSDPKPAVGSIDDDWQSLQRVSQGQQIPTYVDFERFASILRAVAEQIVPSGKGEDENEESDDLAD